jgi:transcriptional regulator with XRE-family HTH domain
VFLKERCVRLITIGERIKNLREKRDWSQRELAKRTKLHTSVLNRIENNLRPVKDEELVIFSDIFGVSSDYLLGNDSTSKIEEEWYEGVQILQRANKKLTPKRKATMIRMIEAMLEGEEDL